MLIPYQLIYVSTLSPDASPRCVADIIRVARIKNAQRDLTGLLVFDGQHFCQYLEGRRTDVVVMGGLIETDPRHTGFRVLHEGPLEGPRLFADWSMGYARADDQDLSAIAACQGASAVADLLTRQRGFDLDP